MVWDKKDDLELELETDRAGQPVFFFIVFFYKKSEMQ